MPGGQSCVRHRDGLQQEAETRPKMRHEGTVELFLYWNRLRDGRPAPKRTEIEPADIRARLADTFILEKDGRGEAVFRLAGSRLCAVFGRELKGFSFAGLWPYRDRDVTGKLCNNTFVDKNVSVIEFEGSSVAGRSNLFELILLPLEGGRDNPRVLGAISPLEKPFWLGVDPITEARVTSIQVVDPDRDPSFLKNRPPVPVPPLSPSSDDLKSPNTPETGGRRVRHLVVLNGGRD